VGCLSIHKFEADQPGQGIVVVAAAAALAVVYNTQNPFPKCCVF
jgi:hypothetical protein